MFNTDVRILRKKDHINTLQIKLRSN